MNGWISLYRDLLESPLWEDKPFTYGQAWIDMLLRANAKDNKVLFGHDLIEVKRGSFITSERKLMEYWGWSRTKVRSFLASLEENHKIDCQKDNKKTTINIVNYGIFQKIKTTESTTEDTTEDTQTINNKFNNNSLYKGNSFSKPTGEEVKAYCNENNLTNVDAEAFINYYESNGWMVGSHKMKDWKATARNWQKRNINTINKKGDNTNVKNSEQNSNADKKHYGFTAW